MALGVLGFARVQGSGAWGGFGIRSIEKTTVGEYRIRCAFNTDNAVETATLGTNDVGWIATLWPDDGVHYTVRTGAFRAGPNINTQNLVPPDNLPIPPPPPPTRVGAFPVPADMLFEIVIVGPTP